MKLDHLHVNKIGAGIQSHSNAIAGVLPRVGCDLPGLAPPTCGQHYRFAFKKHTFSALAPVAKGAADALAVFKEALHIAFHVDVDALVDRVLLEGPDHFETRAISYVGQARVAVPAEIALENKPFFSTVEKGAPFLQFQHSVRRLLRVNLRHAPVVQQFAATHGIAEVNFPVVFRIDISQGRGDAALGHHGVGLAQEGFANQGGPRPLGRGLDSRAQAGATGANDNDIVLVALVLLFRSHQNNLTSVITPIESRRT